MSAQSTKLAEGNCDLKLMAIVPGDKLNDEDDMDVRYEPCISMKPMSERGVARECFDLKGWWQTITAGTGWEM
ncbi:hypothetical protein [Gimesia sp.]|uniref:hypothetical protein n=1 Tax=Gimesia sp. TaxID=2024833 RepID=UPI0032EF3697